MNPGQTNRLLTVNAADFGVCHAVNEAVIRAFENDVLCSTERS